MPAVIYITMNRTIRNDCKSILYNFLYGQSSSRVVAVTTESTHKNTQDYHHDENDFDI